MAFRLLGSNKDYLVVGTDSGKVTVMEFIVAYGQGSWTTLHCETFGKTGCRRIVPGQYLAADPHGRAIMVSAIEKQQLSISVMHSRREAALSKMVENLPQRQ